MQTDLIVNGTFDAGSAGWTGTDLETNHFETAYLGNGSTNRVAELDGHRNQITVMEQSFTVTGTGSFTGTFSIDSALRTASNPQAGTDGFTVEILDSSGGVVGSMTILPTTNSFSTYTMDVTFPGPGTYTLRMTEIGVDDSLGAIIDNVEMLVCFCKGTQITTPEGPRLVEELRVGDLVSTARGPQPLRWIGRRQITEAEIAANDKLRPIRIDTGALGAGLPLRPLYVSRQHRMICRNPVVHKMFDTPEVLVAAIRLTALPGIAVDMSEEPSTYYHLLFDRHETVFAEGAPSESLRITATSLASLSAEGRDELLTLFPAFSKPGAPFPESAAPIPPNARQKSLTRRMAKNRKPPLINVA